MKRGYMCWDQTLLSAAALERRRGRLISLMRDEALDALVIYGDVNNADELVDCSNYGPYWCNCAALLTAAGDYWLVTGHNARVNPWLQEMTGLPEERIVPAGMKVPEKAALQLNSLLSGGIVGLIGKYTPAVLARSITDKGFSLRYLGDFADALLDERDEAQHSTVEKGHALMEAAIQAALESCEGLSVKQCCAELEYAIRSAGAMDVVLLADTGGGFAPPEEEKAQRWSLYANIQYLGAWLSFAFPMGGGAQALYARLDERAGTLRPGPVPLAGKLHTRILSDSLSSLNREGENLREGQLISLCDQGDPGEYVQKMYRVTAQGAIPLGTR
ncbi:MAG: hypothetical protein J5927_03015 [Oscillospiraceae bacterium]|nr:hypothetical protein [Oscillospiraceae bacterium]